jgi:hypothetical protein
VTLGRGCTAQAFKVMGKAKCSFIVREGADKVEIEKL